MSRRNVVALAVAVIVWGQTQIFVQTQYNRDQTRPLSASVLGTLISRQAGEIELLILWRGSPGWFTGPARARGSGGDVYTASLQYGSVALDVSYDRINRFVRIRGTDVSLPTGTNVILVDGVGNNDLKISTVSSDLTYPEAAPVGGPPKGPSDADIAAILSRSSAIVSFLQCDTPANRNAVGKLSRYVCDTLRIK